MTGISNQEEHDGAGPAAEAVFADGVTDRKERVTLELSDTDLEIISERGVRVAWPLAQLRAVPDDDGARRGLTVREAGGSPARLIIKNPHIADHLRRVAPTLADGYDVAEGASEDAVFADFADGDGANLHRVALELSSTHLEIVFPDGARRKWALIDLRALRDQAHSDGLVLSNGHAAMARLYIDNPHIAAQIRSVGPDLDLRAPITNWGRIIGWAGGAVASVAAIIFLLVPIMADQLAAYLPPEGEAALGDATFEQIRNALGDFDAPVALCKEPEGQAALDKMVARLNPDPGLPYPIKLAVLDHDLVNAFALPGGHVVLFRGIIEAAETPDEIASILAHEFGHVVNRDPTRDALRSAGSIGVLGLLFGDFAGGTVVLMLSNQLINAKYSQAAEVGADDYAHDLMEGADLDPAALGSIFQRFHEKYGDAEGIMAHFSSHPQMEARIEAARESSQGKTFGPPSLNDAEWQALRRICGPIDTPEDGAGEDPDTATGGALGGQN